MLLLTGRCCGLAKEASELTAVCGCDAAFVDGSDVDCCPGGVSSGGGCDCGFDPDCTLCGSVGSCTLCIMGLCRQEAAGHFLAPFLCW